MILALEYHRSPGRFAADREMAFTVGARSAR
jgi:hypothetical protein